MFIASPDHVASWYADSCRALQVPRPPLAGDLAVDVAIVGAGLTGLGTALHLAEAGLSVAVIEASRIGWAASGRNGGQLVLGYSCDMPPFEAALGLAGARRVWDLTRDAAAGIRARVARHAIDCELRDGHLWTSVLARRVPLLTHWQREAADKYGHDRLQLIGRAELADHVDSARYQAGLLDPEGGHLHPLKYVLGLARAAEAAGARLFEGTRATAWEHMGDGIRLHTAQGTLHAGRLVLAANAYVDRLDERLRRRVLPVGTYMVATEPLAPARAAALMPSRVAVTDNQFVLDYFRLSADHRLLFGGKCTYTGRTPRHLAQGMRADLLRVFPQLADLAITHAWGGHIDITVRRTPDFGQQGPVLWAQGFSGHGLVPTAVAARVLSQAILGQGADLALFQRLHNPPFPGGERLAALLQVAGKGYYRLRDLF